MKIAEIVAKRLSDAFLSMASDFSKLSAPAPLSQAEPKPEFVSLKRNVPSKMWNYKPQEKVLVRFTGSESSFKMRILKKLSDSEYLVYHQNQVKSEAVKATTDEILGLDPDR
ncbi:hypothetical protein HCU40_16665 [Pseudanabaena biceps]|nr:hypothetical protein [Pseudanabaena biceps]